MSDLAELEMRRHRHAVAAYQQRDNPTWTRMWDECAQMARQAAELCRAAGDTEAAESWERTAAHDTHNADVFRNRPNDA